MNRLAPYLLLAVLCLATAAHAQTVEVIPNATQPTAAPVVKVQGSGWTAENVIALVGSITALIVAVGALLPGVAAWIKSLKNEQKSVEQDARLDRQGEVQTQQLIREGTGTGNGTPPGGGA